MTLVVVTATTDPERARPCLESWALPADVPLVIIVNGRTWTPSQGEATGLQAKWTVSEAYLGTVPAFALGVDQALRMDAEIIACLHDDLAIHDLDWTGQVRRLFQHRRDAGLCGFGGALGLGAADIYQTPYDPYQLARQDFLSNLDDAEVHGTRSELPRQVACLDGFSQIGRRAFFQGITPYLADHTEYARIRRIPDPVIRPPAWGVWQQMADRGLVHHAYDAVLGALAAQAGWETWYLPVSCRHHGGRTAVADVGYQAWAQTQHPDGDHGLWEQSHRIVYDWVRGILPLRIGGR